MNPPRVLARQVASAAAFAAGVAVFAASTRSRRLRPALVFGGVSPSSRSAVFGGVCGRRVRRGLPAFAPLSRGRAPRRPLPDHVPPPPADPACSSLLTALSTLVAVAAGPGFWIGVSVTGFLLVAFVVHLRNRALTEQRDRRAEQQYAAWVARRQAAVRREQAQARRGPAARVAGAPAPAREEARRRGELRGTPYWGRAARRLSSLGAILDAGRCRAPTDVRVPGVWWGTRSRGGTGGLLALLPARCSAGSRGCGADR